ncbi:MAG: TonB-dependent receptor, partial [Acidobacteria bacterium]|nr:TonB-dependent receptor [Acidobacteriota bacterium]
LSPTFLFDSVFAYSRFDQTVFGPDHGKNWGAEIWGIPGTNDPIGPGASDVLKRCPGTACYSGQPPINNGYTQWGNGDGWMPLWRNDRSFTYDVNLTKIHGAHELRWGFGLVRHHMDHWQPEVSGGPRGVINFAGDTTATTGYTANYFNQFATTLLGLPSGYQKALQFLLMTNREWQFGWYARDRWQISRNLTLNLGLRYEYYPLITRKDRGIERWDPATNQVFMGGIGNVPRNVGITTSKKMFGPRIGFAYRVTENTVIRSGYGITYDPLPFARPLRGLYPASIGATFTRLDPYTWYNNLSQGIPVVPVPDISTGVLTLPPDVDMGPRSPWAGELHRGYIQSWNFTVERKLPADLVTSVAYVGTQTVHWLVDRDINAAPPGTGAAGRPLFATQGRRIGASMWDGWLNGNYHALQVAVNRYFTRGLMLKGAYTWSKAINYTDDDGWAGLPLTNWLPALDRNRARAGYDRTHMFVMGWVYELPFGEGKRWATSGPARQAFGGWQINGTFSSYTGTPFGVGADGAGLNAPGSNQTADLVKPAKKLGGVGPGQPFYDPLSFAQPTGVRFGSTGRNFLTGPGIVNMDMSVFRSFRMTERLSMEFRAEGYNLSNTPHFNNPGANVANMRLNPDGSIQALGNFMCITGANTRGGQEPGDERQIRFGLRFSF